MEQRKSGTKYVATPKSLRTVLKDKDINRMKDVADMVGVKEATISRFDKQTRYDTNTLVSIMKVFDLTIDDLFTIKENEDFEGAD